MLDSYFSLVVLARQIENNFGGQAQARERDTPRVNSVIHKLMSPFRHTQHFARNQVDFQTHNNGMREFSIKRVARDVLNDSGH